MHLIYIINMAASWSRSAQRLLNQSVAKGLLIRPLMLKPSIFLSCFLMHHSCLRMRRATMSSCTISHWLRQLKITLLTSIYGHFNAFFSAIHAATVSALIWLFTGIPPGQDVSFPTSWTCSYDLGIIGSVSFLQVIAICSTRSKRPRWCPPEAFDFAVDQ